MIKDAFPDYPVDSLPDMPERFMDVSWRNDACPSFDLGRGLHLYCDYPTQEDREYPGGFRYIVMQDSGESELVLCTDLFDDVLWVASYDRPSGE
jgi:hypothetical protein